MIYIEPKFECVTFSPAFGESPTGMKCVATKTTTFLLVDGSAMFDECEQIANGILFRVSLWLH